MRSNKYYLIVIVIFVLGAVFAVGIFFGYQQRPYIERVSSVFKNDPPEEFTEIDFNSFWKVWNLIEEKYVSKDELNREDMLYGAMSGLAKAVGDPYTVFLPPEEKEMFDSEINGEFEGIGAEIGLRNNMLVIISPLEGSPAKAAGLKAGDRVLKIEDDDTSIDTIDITLEEAVRNIRGVGGTKVILTVIRNGEENSRKITITRAKILIPVIQTELGEDNIFVIRLFSFSNTCVVASVF